MRPQCCLGWLNVQIIFGPHSFKCKCKCSDAQVQASQTTERLKTSEQARRIVKRQISKFCCCCLYCRKLLLFLLWKLYHARKLPGFLIGQLASHHTHLLPCSSAQWQSSFYCMSNISYVGYPWKKPVLTQISALLSQFANNFPHKREPYSTSVLCKKTLNSQISQIPPLGIFARAHRCMSARKIWT